MKAFNTILLTLGVTLVLVDVSLRLWAWSHFSDNRAFARQFTLEASHTNNASGIAIFYAKTKEPLWSDFTFNDDTNSLSANND
jgi:hypothetical protein